MGRGLAYNEALSPEGSQIADQGADILRIRQSIECGQKRRHLSTPELIQSYLPGYSSQPKNSLEHGESSQSGQHILLSNKELDPFRPGFQKRLKHRAPSGGDKDGQYFEIRIQKPPYNFFTLGNKHATSEVIHLIPHRAERTQGWIVEIAYAANVNHGFRIAA